MKLRVANVSQVGQEDFEASLAECFGDHKTMWGRGSVGVVSSMVLSWGALQFGLPLASYVRKNLEF